MRAGSLAAGTFLVLALALGASGCGGGGAKAKREAAVQARADADWRAGISHWHHEMLRALNGISLLLSAQRPIELLRAADPATDAELAAFERSLVRCSAVVRGFGPAPPTLTDARQSALRACADLEDGARLVETAVGELRHGRGSDAFNPATGPLSAGQSEMEVAAKQVRRARSS